MSSASALVVHRHLATFVLQALEGGSEMAPGASSASAWAAHCLAVPVATGGRRIEVGETELHGRPREKKSCPAMPRAGLIEVPIILS